MPWFYNSHSGEITHASVLTEAPYIALLHAGIGWHELPVPDSASLATAEAAAKRIGGASPTTSIPKGFGNAATSVAGGGIQGLGKIVNAITSRQTLIRLAEGIAGIALIIVAVDKLASGTAAGKMAHTAAKAAFLA